MRKFLVCLCLALLSGAAAVNAQEKTLSTNAYSAKSAFGISDAALFDEYMLTVEGVGSSARDLLSEQSLKSYMMPPRKMGSAGQSAAYALASCLEYYVNLNNNYKDNLSPDYLKLSLPQGSVEDELAFLSSNGTVSAAILPFESPNLTPSVHAAVKYRIRNYLKLFQNTTRPQQKIYELKKAITRGNPVIVEMQITNDFKSLRQTRYWNPQNGDKSPAGTHYLTVVGYDEERKAVELLNCWGKEWGNGGYIWVNYDDFATLAQNAFVLIF